MRRGPRTSIIKGRVLLDAHASRLAGHRRLPPHYASSRALLPRAFREEHRRLFCFRPQRVVVAGGNEHGGDDVRCGHAAGGHGTRLQAGDCGQLALVVLPSLRHDDGVSLRALVAAVRAAHGRATRRNPLFRQARGFSAGLSRAVPGSADELPDSRLGDQGNDRHRLHDAGSQRAFRAGHLCFVPDAVHGNLRDTGWIVGRALDRPLPVRAEDGNCDRCGLVRCVGGWRHEQPGAETCGDARGGGKQRRRYHGILSGFFAAVNGGAALDVAGPGVCGLSRAAMVGFLVSRSGTRRRGLHRAKDLQRAR